MVQLELFCKTRLNLIALSLSALSYAVKKAQSRLRRKHAYGYFNFDLICSSRSGKLYNPSVVQLRKIEFYLLLRCLTFVGFRICKKRACPVNIPRSQAKTERQSFQSKNHSFVNRAFLIECCKAKTTVLASYFLFVVWFQLD